jgi:C4-dicarboxylate transporter DctQ subunit
MMLLHAGWLSFFGGKEVTNYRQSGALGYWTLMYNTGIGLDDLRYPVWMQETFGLQERVQRWVAYLMLPIGLALLAFRSLQAFIDICARRARTDHRRPRGRRPRRREPRR